MQLSADLKHPVFRLTITWTFHSYTPQISLQYSQSQCMLEIYEPNMQTDHLPGIQSGKYSFASADLVSEWLLPVVIAQSIQWIVYGLHDRRIIIRFLTADTHYPYRYKSPPSFLYNGYRRCGWQTDHSPSSNVEVKDLWNCTSTPPYFLMTCYLIKHKGQFTLVTVFGNKVKLSPKQDRLCDLVAWVPGYTMEMYCASCEVRTEFICYVEESRPPLWSSGQSSWLQI
jgi:hypothetical protein